MVLDFHQIIWGSNPAKDTLFVKDYFLVERQTSIQEGQLLTYIVLYLSQLKLQNFDVLLHQEISSIVVIVLDFHQIIWGSNPAKDTLFVKAYFLVKRQTSIQE